MAYELESLETGQRMALHDRDWESLLGLACRHGWQSPAGLDRYLGGGKRLISASEARALAAALEGPLGDLPPERRQELRPTGAAPGGAGPIVEAPVPGPVADHEGHFAWQRRWIVEEVVMFCRQGAIEVRPM